MKILSTICIVALIIGFVTALNYDGIEENYTCDKFTVDPNLKDDWSAPFKVIYTILWNKVELYSTAEDLWGTDEFAKLTLEDLHKTCAYYKENGTKVDLYGFGGRRVSYETFPDPIRKGIEYWTAPGTQKYDATTYITKTDNKSYFVGVSLLENGMKGVSVGSIVPKLDPDKIKEIKEHLVKIGFKVENFIEHDYANCPPPPFGVE